MGIEEFKQEREGSIQKNLKNIGGFAEYWPTEYRGFCLNAQDSMLGNVEGGR